MANTNTDLTLRPLMILDGDADDTELIRLLLRKAGIENPLHVYQRGEEMIAALSALLATSVALLPLICFLELALPDMSGQEVLRWMRQNAAFDDVSAVMLARSDEPADIQAAAEGGAQCYLAKYPQPAVLRRVVQEANHLAANRPANHWFGLSANQFLRWGAFAHGARSTKASTAPAVVASLAPPRLRSRLPG